MLAPLRVAVRGARRLLGAARRARARAAAASKIARIDDREIPPTPHEIRAFMVVRNESLRLPFLLRRYLESGVDRIFVLDNNSSDDTAAIVLAHNNTHLFSTADSYANQAAWIDLLLHRYGVGRWCLVVDADEVLIYPHDDTVTLPELCGFLERQSADALDCILLDMYPRQSLTGARYERGANPLATAGWFDESPYAEYCEGPCYVTDQKLFYEGPARLTGGARKRVFGSDACLSKFPLIKFKAGMYLAAGTHWVQGARVADMRGGLLHFKFLDDFAGNVGREIERGEHWNNAIEYRGYGDVLGRTPELSLWHPQSAKFQNSAQLVGSGLMRTSPAFEAYSAAHAGRSG
jgi:glycosyltransferase involved in cell wall biosynthesis